MFSGTNWIDCCCKYIFTAINHLIYWNVNPQLVEVFLNTTCSILHKHWTYINILRFVISCFNFIYHFFRFFISFCFTWTFRFVTVIPMHKYKKEFKDHQGCFKRWITELDFVYTCIRQSNSPCISESYFECQLTCVHLELSTLDLTTEIRSIKSWAAEESQLVLQQLSLIRAY